jgi:hypothetical protein
MSSHTLYTSPQQNFIVAMVNDEQGSEHGSKPDPEKKTFLSSLEKPLVGAAKKIANTVTTPIQAAVNYRTSRDDVEGEESVSRSATSQDSSSGKAINAITGQIRKGTGNVRNVVKAELGKIRVPSLNKEKNAPPEVEEGENDGLPTLPPDEMLESMEVIITKRLTNVSVQDFYEIFWSEGNGTDKKPFYGPWLADSGKMDVNIGDWDVAEDEQGIVNEWDKKVYQQKREVTFRFERTNQLGSGPSIVDVKHTQYLRVDGNDRCVVSTTMKMGGIPFSDCFDVQVRWVATRVGKRDLSIKVGLFVFFVKQILVAGQIRSGTTKATTASQLDLFINMKKACGSEEVIVLEKEGPSVDLLAKYSSNFLSFCFPFFQSHTEYKDDIDRTIHEVREKMGIVRTLPAGAAVAEKEENRKYFLSEFSIAQKALNNILIRKMGVESSIAPKEKDTTVSSEDGAAKLVNSFAAPFKRFHEKYISTRRGKETTKREGPMEHATEKGNFEPPAPDEVLKGMNVIITKVLDDASVKDFYSTCLSETDKEPFYGSWLTRSGKTDVKVEGWTFAEDEQGFVNEWDLEHYPQKREVTFKFERSSFGLHGPSIASVKQTQYCRVEGDNKCVFAMTIETEGVPFSDSFNVQFRWVLTRVGKNKIAIKVGVFVVFLKQILIAGKIRAGVTQEGLKQQLDLFRSVKTALVGPTGQESIDKQYGLEDSTGPLAVIAALLENCLSRAQKMTKLYPESMIEDDEELAKQMKTMEQKIRAIGAFLDERDPSDSTENMNFFLSELVVVREALDNIIQWHGDQDQGLHSIEEASFVPKGVETTPPSSITSNA